MFIKNFILPDLFDSSQVYENQIFLYIDQLRATSTLCSIFHNGAKKVYFFEQINETIYSFESSNYFPKFLVGERDGKKIQDFHFGNSPLEFFDNKVIDANIFMTSSNGTKIFKFGNHPSNFRFVLCFNNILATVQRVINTLISNQLIDTINLICASNNGRVSYDDTIVSGAFIDQIIKTNSLKNQLQLDDSSILAYHSFLSSKNDITNIAKQSSHSKHLIELGFENDIDFCFEINTSSIVPKIINNYIEI